MLIRIFKCMIKASKYQDFYWIAAGELTYAKLTALLLTVGLALWLALLMLLSKDTEVVHCSKSKQEARHTDGCSNFQL